MISNALVAVTGATGSQGGGVVNALMANTKAKIKAITRNASSPKAKALPYGVEVVEADLSDKASMTKALDGVKYLFLVTDFYGGAQGNAEIEIQQGKNAVDAAKEAGVKMVIFSSMEPMREEVTEKLPKLEGGRIIPHFESKAEVAEYLKHSGLDYTILITSIFFENVINYTMYQKQPDGSLVMGDNLGTEPHAWHAVGDIGLTVAAVVNDPAKYKGQIVPVVGEHISYPEIADTISSVTGKTVKYYPLTDEQVAAWPMPTAREFANMFSYYRHFPYYDELRSLDKRAAAGPSFKEWAQAHKEQLQKKLEAA